MDFKKQLTITISVAFVFIIIISVATILLLNDSQKKAGQISRIKTDISQKNSELETLIYLEADSQKAKPYLDRLSSFLVTNEQLINSKKDLAAMAQANKTNLNMEFKAEHALNNNEARTTDIILALNSASGTLSNVANLFKAIENSKYLIKFTMIDLNLDAGRINGNLNGKIFSF